MSLLFIWYKRSKGTLEGGGQVSQMNYSQLRKLVGADQVSSYYIHDENKGKSILGYVKGIFYTPFGYYYGLTPSRVKEIVAIAKGEKPLEEGGMSHPYDMVFIDRSLFGIVAKTLKQSGYKGRIITYFHNVETIYFDAKLNKRLPFRNVFLKCVDRNDCYSCRYSDKVVALNMRDATVIESTYGRKVDVLIPVAMEDRCTVQPNAQVMTRKKPLCLFLGAYFPPNNEGILWFIHHVLPQVDIEMRVVGKGMSKLKAENAELKDIEVVSDVPDLVPYFNDADLMILPIFSGSGMKVKTCESLMHGKHILGTQEAFEGYEGDYEQIGGLCGSADDFIAKLNEFAQHPRERFNVYSRQLYLEKYSMTAVAESYKKLMSE